MQVAQRFLVMIMMMIILHDPSEPNLKRLICFIEISKASVFEVF